MPAGDALSKLVERSMGQRATEGLALRATQVGTKVLNRPEFAPEEKQVGQFKLNPEQESRAVEEWLYGHKPLADAPELFAGPFLTLGTKLQLGPPSVQFVVDMVTDPWTYVPGIGLGGKVAEGVSKVAPRLGSAMMSMGARTARLTSALGKGAEKIGGAAILDEVERALSAAGKILGSGKREAMLEAARKGSGELGGLIDEALKVGKMDPEIAKSLTAMKTDRKSLAWILDNSDEILGYDQIPSHLIPQKNVFSRIATGQAEDFIKFGIPSVNPVNLSRQLIGIGYQGERFYTPFAKSIAARGVRNAIGPTEGILSGSAAAYQGLRRFAERPFKTGDISVNDFSYTLDHIDSVLGSPLDRKVRAVEEIPFDSKEFDRVWNSIPKEKRAGLDKDVIAEKWLGYMRRQTLDSDRAALRQRQSVIDEMAGAAEQEAQPFGPPAPGVGADLAQRGMLQAAQVRRYADSFSVQNLIREGASKDFHLTLANNLQQNTHFASIMHGQGMDVLVRNFGGIAQAQEVDSVLRYWIEQPEAFYTKVVNGHERTFLKADAVKPGSLFADRLSLSKGDSLRTMLTTQGAPPEVTQMVARIKSSWDTIGTNLKNEKALAGFLDNYWGITFNRNSKFGKRFGEGAQGLQALTDSILYNPENLADIAPDLAKDAKALVTSAKGQKLSVQQLRKVTDDLRAALERAGYGTYSNSSMGDFAHAVDAYGKAHLERHLLDNFGALSGHSPYEDLPPEIKRLVTADAWNAVDKDGVSHTRDLYGDLKTPSAAIQPAFMKVTMRSGVPKEVSDFKAATAAADLLVEEARAAGIEGLKKSRLAGLPEEAALSREATEAAIANIESGRAEATLNKRIDEVHERIEAMEALGSKTKEAVESLHFRREAHRELGELVGRRNKIRSGEEVKRLRAELDELTPLKVAEKKLDEAEEQIAGVAEAGVARKLAGVKQIKTASGKVIRIRAAQIREGLPGNIEGVFDPDWIKHGYPEHLRYAKEIEAEVKGRISEEALRLREGLERKRELLRTAHAKGRAAAVKATHKDISAVRKATEKAAKSIAEEEAGRAPARATIWIRKDLANHLIEPLKLWEQQGMNKATTSWLGKLNANLKGGVLLGDFFHLHSLTMNQIAARGPVELFKMLLDPNGNLLPGVKAGAFGETEVFARMRGQAVLSAAAGAAGGAATGAAMEGDPGQIGALSLTGAVYGAALGAARINDAWGKRLALSPDGFEFLYHMGKGGWVGRPDDRSIGMFSRWMKSLRDDIIRKHPDSILISPIDGLKHINDVWENELWGTAHNGGKHWLFAATWQDEVAKLEKKASYIKSAPVAQEQMKEALAREVMQFVNHAMGSQNVAALLAHPQWMHYARWGLLAPNWTASRLQMASGFFHGRDPVSQALIGATLGTALEAAEAGFDPDEMTGMGLVGGAALGVTMGKWSQRVASRLMTKGDVTAKLAQKATSTALLGGLAVAMLLNKALSGHYLWENEEGKKTSIELPGRTETGRKRYLSFGKQWLEAFEFAAISEKEGFAVPVAGRLESKLSVPLSWTVSMLKNDNGYYPIVTADQNAVERIGNIMSFTAGRVSPIIVQGPARLAGAALQGKANAGGVAEAAVRFAGFPLSRSPHPMSSPLNAGGFLNAIRPLVQPSGALISSDPTSLERAFR